MLLTKRAIMLNRFDWKVLNHSDANQEVNYALKVPPRHDGECGVCKSWGIRRRTCPEMRGGGSLEASILFTFEGSSAARREEPGHA